MRGYQQENKTRVKQSYKYRHHCAQHDMTRLQIQTKRTITYFDSCLYLKVSEGVIVV